MNFLFDVFAKYDLQILLTKYNIVISVVFLFSCFCMFVCFVFAAEVPSWRNKVYMFHIDAFMLYSR